MAPAQNAPVPTDKEKRIRKILGNVIPKLIKSFERLLIVVPAFAAVLESQLPAAASSRAPGALHEEVEKHISIFPNFSSLGTAAAAKFEEIDSVGTTLWNLCTRLLRDHEPDDSKYRPDILLNTRVFAFLLLNCAHESGKGTSGNLLRLMKIGIKAAKSSLGIAEKCLTSPANLPAEVRNTDLSVKVLEKVAKLEEALKPHSDTTPEDSEDCERLCAEYFVLRTALVGVVS